MCYYERSRLIDSDGRVTSEVLLAIVASISYVNINELLNGKKRLSLVKTLYH